MPTPEKYLHFAHAIKQAVTSAAECRLSHSELQERLVDSLGTTDERTRYLVLYALDAYIGGAAAWPALVAQTTARHIPVELSY